MNRAIGIFLRERSLRFRLFIEGIAVGGFAGIVVGLFRYLLAESEVWRPVVYDIIKENTVYIVPYIISFIVFAFILAYIVKKEPMCTGSGIPQIKGILQGQMKMDWLRVIICKLIGGVIAIGAGMSLGREGPSVQLGACCGQGISRNRRRTRTEERILLTAGAGAGLAAAFNAPLAGVIFCMEELSKTFSSVILTAAIGASVTATTVSWLLFDRTPVFHIDNLAMMPMSMFGVLILLGLFVGSLALLFNPCLMISLAKYENSFLTGWRKPLLPLLLAAGLGFVLPDVLGGGNHLIDAIIAAPYPLLFLWMVFIGKFIYTMFCFGSGVPGGIFLPMLVLGGTSGAVFGTSIMEMGIMPAEFLPHMIVYGMAAYFASVVKSPVTGAILIMEMTGSFNHILPLIIVSMTAYMVSDMAGGAPVYDMLLNRSINKAKH